MLAIVWTDFNRWKAGKKKTAHFTENPLWIAYRMTLLRHYCVKSVGRQKDWPPHSVPHVVLCNPRTKSAVVEYAKVFEHQPMFLFGKAEEEAFLARTVHGDDWVALIRIDSDDMYHPSAIADFLKYGDGELLRGRFPRYAYFRLGYAYNYKTRQMRTYDTHCVGPFFCHYWKGEDLLKFGRIGDPLRHHQIRDAKLIGGRRFVVGMHAENTSSGMCSRFTGVRIPEPQYSKVKEIYGL